MFKLYALFILVPKFPDLSFFWKFKTSSPPTPYYSSSLYILGIYALRVTLILPRGRAFKLFAASAERKCIFEHQKSMNPEVLGWFSRLSYFLNFQWFWAGFTINFISAASFPARGWSQIARRWNIKPIQIFAFIWCSCADPGPYPTTSNILPFDTRLRPSDAE